MKIATTFAATFIGLLSYTLKAQLPNAGLETWSNVTVSTTFEEPQGWGTTNASEDLLGDPVSVTKSTSMHGGSYAMKMESSTSSIVTAIAGASPISYNLGDGFAYTSRPASLDFYYKFTYDGHDSATFWVIFTANNGTQVIGDGELYLDVTQSNYTAASIPMSYYQTGNPDHVAIWIVMGNEDDPSNNTGASVLYVDDFVFTGGTVNGVDHLSDLRSDRVSVYPNPGNGVYNINIDENLIGAQLNVYNVLGNKISQTVCNNVQQQINLTQESKGIYFYDIVSDGKSVTTGKIVKQ